MRGVEVGPQDAPVLVRVQNLKKSYPRFSRRRERLSALVGLSSGPARHLALDGVSFEVAAGTALGIVGENGSGKSTLLRIVAGIAAPDAGTVEVAKPVAGLLELGLGFHPEFTGRENALLYGSLLGIPRGEMEARLAAILDFAELGAFAEQPLRTYSSGMAARLAFAVATEVEPAVLVVDEALAVGDGAFQKKCVDRMIRFKEGGRSVLFCSHSLYLVASFCEQVLWLHQGRVQAFGATQEVLEAYQEHLAQKSKRAAGSGLCTQAGTRHTPRIVSLRVPGIERVREPGEPLEICIQVGDSAPLVPYHLAVAVDGVDGTSLVTASTAASEGTPFPARGALTACCRFQDLPLASGRYVVSAFLLDETGLAVFDQVRLGEKLVVKSTAWRPSLLFLPHRWEIVKR